jgi:hypothetical protein
MKIMASPEQNFEAGHYIILTCVMMKTLEPMEEIFEFKSDYIINNAINEAIRIMTDRELGTNQFIISGAKSQDSGNCTCSLSSFDFATVVVFVLDEPNQDNSGLS